jgi:NAD(P)-dependent dehydrogenase (short-subunit alcohol dehydrogenase family)
LLEKSKSNPRIVFVGSGVHNPKEGGGNVGSKATLGDMKGLADGFTGTNVMVDGGAYDVDKAYKDSKLCNVVTGLELAKRLAKNKSKITSNIMNPGLIPTTGLIYFFHNDFRRKKILKKFHRTFPRNKSSFRFFLHPPHTICLPRGCTRGRGREEARLHDF